jgi:hypothetical protein
MKKRPAGKSKLSVFDKHQLRIALDTLKMDGRAIGVMGGPNKAEARAIIARLTGKAPTHEVSAKDYTGLLFRGNPTRKARRNPPVDALELIEEMIDKSSVKRVVTLVAEVCELKAQHVQEAWQDSGLAKTWEHDAKALINFVSKLKN